MNAVYTVGYGYNMVFNIKGARIRIILKGKYYHTGELSLYYSMKT